MRERFLVRIATDPGTGWEWLREGLFPAQLTGVAR
jgi:hypothetical protein